MAVKRVIELNRELLERKSVIAPGAGYSPKEITQAEKRMARAFPQELRELFEACKPIVPDRRANWLQSLLPLDDEDARWFQLLEDKPHPFEIVMQWEPSPFVGWDNSRGFMFAATPCFDRMFYVERAPGLPDGAIMLTNHEAADPIWCHRADSLAEYIAELCEFGWLDLAYYPGDLTGLDTSKVAKFARRHVERNPSSRHWREYLKGH